jgi:tripartite-type tricarboxylate transporter receptor subunit TctC
MGKKFCVFWLTVLAMIVFGPTGCSKKSTDENSIQADKFPEHPITVIITSNTGGAVEEGARIWQAALEKELGVPLNFEFHGGASGQVGYTLLTKRDPDGYTIGVGNPINISNTMLLQNAEYQWEDFDFICNYEYDPGVLMAHNDEPYNNLTELIAYAKTQPPKSFAIGVPTMQDPNIIGLRQLENATGIQFNIVPFAGGGKLRAALAGHQIQLGAFRYTSSEAISEQAKLIGVMERDTKNNSLKNIQSFSDAAGTNLDNVVSLGSVMAPKGLLEKYPERYKILLNAFKKSFESPELHENLVKLDRVDWLVPVFGDEEMKKFNAEWFDFCKRNIQYMQGE